jgi:hypothetical protein
MFDAADGIAVVSNRRCGPLLSLNAETQQPLVVLDIKNNRIEHEATAAAGNNL